MQQGFYLTSVQECDFCDANCKECWGISTNCTQCLEGYTLTANNTCKIAVTTSTPVFDFFNNQNNMPSSWATNTGNLSDRCSNYYFVVGYNGLGNTKIENNSWNSDTISTTDVTGAGWTMIGISGSYITTCGSYTLVGGDGFFGAFATMSRNYTSLKPHLYARITFYLMKEGNRMTNNSFLFLKHRPYS